MNREERRHPSKAARVRKIIEDFNTVRKIQKALGGGWTYEPGDKVKLDMEKIMADKEYDRKLPTYRAFCEANAERVFTVEYVAGMNPSVVCLAEDESNPKWLFWIGHLKPA